MHTNNRWIEICIIAFLFLFLAVIIGGIPGHPYDMFCFRSWANNINEHGLTKAYISDTDYLPLYQYFLWLYTKLTGTGKLIWDRIGYLRLFTLVFELVGLWYVYKWIEKKTDFIMLIIFSLLNIAFSYNTLVWGQVDGMLAAMVFMSVYFAYNKKLLFSVLWFVLALNLKLQAIVFAPVLGFLYLYAMEKVDVRKLITGVVAIAAVQLLILLPFIQTAESRHNLHEAVVGSVGRYPFISIYAFNFWYWLFPQEGAIKLNDGQIWFPHVTYHRFGSLLFCASSFFALWPLLKILYKKFIRKVVLTVDANKLMLICALIPILFFFCNTQMHERYPHPAFFFLTAYAFRTKDFIPYILFSIAYFLNIEKELQWFKLQNYDTVLFNAGFVAGLYTLLIAYLFVRIYHPKSAKQKDVLAS